MIAKLKRQLLYLRTNDYAERFQLECFIRLAEEVKALRKQVKELQHLLGINQDNTPGCGSWLTDRGEELLRDLAAVLAEDKDE